MKLLIVVPSYGGVSPGTNQGLVALSGAMDKLAAARLKRLGVEDYTWLFIDGWGLAPKQNDAFKKVLEHDCDAVLSIETDITFMPRHVARLVESYTEKATLGPCMVGALYPSSSAPNTVVGSLRASDEPHARGPMTAAETAFLEDAFDREAVLPAWCVGMGFTIFGRPLVEQMVALHRYPFEEPLDDTEEAGLVTSDTIICQRVRAAGMEIYADLGCQVGHSVKLTMTIADLIGSERARKRAAQ